MISIICAIGKNREIGFINKLLWDIPEDMAHFKKITMGHPVIMGGNTFLSIGRALPGRKNIVVTRESNFEAPGCEISHSLEEILEKYRNIPEEAFIIGGGQIYAQSLPFSDKLYLTIIEDEPEADTFFPDYGEFKKIIKEESGESNGFKFKFMELTK